MLGQKKNDFIISGNLGRANARGFWSQVQGRMVNSFKVILKVVPKTSGKSVESSNNDVAWTLLPKPEKPPALAVMGTKFIGADCHRKHLLPQRKSGAHTWQPGQCVWLGEGSRQDPHQSCLGSLWPAGLLGPGELASGLLCLYGSGGQP